MKEIGIVGGVAWLSTVECYSENCRRSERWRLAKKPPRCAVDPTFREHLAKSDRKPGGGWRKIAKPAFERQFRT